MPRKGKGSKYKKGEIRSDLQVKAEFADNSTALALRNIGARDIATIEKAFYGSIAALGYEGYLYFDEETAIPNPQALLVHKDPQVSYANLYQLFRKIKSDGLIHSLSEVRTNAVIGCDWDIVPGGKDRIDIEIAEFCKANLEAHFNLIDLFEHIVGSAIDYGFSVTEMVPFPWEDPPYRGKMGVRLKDRPAGWFCFDGKERLRFLSKNSDSDGEIVPAKRFIVGQYKPEPLNPYGNGLLGVSFWVWLAKKYGQKWRLIFLERYGIPAMVGVYDDDSKKRPLYEALLAAIQDVVMTVPAGTDIKFPDIDRRSTHDVFQSHLSYEDDTLRYIWLGQTLSTKEGEYGTRAQAEVHERVRDDLVEYDIKSLWVPAMEGQYIRPLVDMNYPRESFTDYPSFYVGFESAIDQKTIAEGLDIMENKLDMLLTDEYKYSKLGVPMPDKKELEAMREEREARKPKPPPFVPIPASTGEEQTDMETEESPEEEKKEFTERKKKVSVFGLGTARRY